MKEGFSKITISGMPGSGKTTLAKNLAKILGYEFISIGNLQGLTAEKLGMTINKYMELSKQKPELHKEMDKVTTEIGKTKNKIVVEGWAAYYFIPDSKKIYLYANEKIAAERIFKNQRPDEPKYKTEKEARIKTRIRYETSKQGIQKAHGIDISALSNFDLILNVSNRDEKQTLDRILKKIKQYQNRI
ncbi:MAG: cytidylate kinase family protein [Candidatus Pacearchaeota archaeon]|jgi:cytidylate kinase